ncbi:ankyrin repeat-containing domain protein [Ephemerocybe angulata]|uniref:Ankyrin repeat-containing domain protein n=1 Tax=Ephemerocybe angulata TaxID=980116 RepID=A0A8H6MFL3_9AGAR|nr:ankyrin repeat-containing domain protein [Tulosesus angulatus]
MFPPFIGLIFLLGVNLVFIVDIELALKQNVSLQGKDEGEWGFGQILAMLLLFMPLRDLAETILARRMKQRQKDLDMALAAAINANDESMVRTWIARGANPNAKFEAKSIHGGISAMRMACNLERLAIIRILLEAGVDPNIEGGSRRDRYKIDGDNKDSLRLLHQVEAGSLDPVKALVQAARNGYGATIKALLGFLEIKLDEKESFLEAFRRNNVNGRNTDRIASPATKAQEFESAILKLLLGAPYINSANTWNEVALLASASHHGHKGTAKLLLAAPEIDVNRARKSDGRTPLSLATENGHEAVVELLLTAHGIDVNAPDDSRMTPLTFAAKHGHEAIVKLLLAAPGIDVNAPGAHGMSPLSFGAERGHEAVIKLLLAAPGIDVNALDLDRWTPLTFAAREGYEAGVKLLLAAPGIDVNALNASGGTPLRFAAAGGHEAVVTLLLAVPGIDVNAPDTKGWTPLIYAVGGGHEGIVKLLLAAPGINVNAADTSGWTALLWAAFQGREAIVQDLCTVPVILVDVADIKWRLENPPEGSQWNDPALKYKQEKCVRILEEFVESKGGGAQDGSEGGKPSGGPRDGP